MRSAALRPSFWLRALLLAALCLAARAAAAVPEQPVRIVATGGRIGYTFYAPAAANTAFRHRSPHKLGGPVSEMQVGFMDWMYPTSSAETPNVDNEVTLTHVWLERAATGQVVPLTFAGARQLVLPKNGTTSHLLSDPVPSSVWTGAPPARDEVFWLHARGTIPEGGKLPVGTSTSYAGARFVVYPPANDTGVFDVGGPVPTISGGATRTEGLPLVFLGRYTGPGHLAVIGIGDSILHGTGDSTGGAIISGSGFFNRAALDADGANTIATFNLTRHGQTASSWVTASRQTRQTPFLRYANVVVEEYGTNDLGSGGTGDPATILGRLDTIWSTARAQGVQKIVRTLLLPRTSSTDAWRTADAQTPNTGWGPGGKRDTINAGLRAARASGKIDHLLDTLAILADPADDTRWLTDGTTANYVTNDGTHIGPRGNALLATALRDALLSLSIDDYAAWRAAIAWPGGAASASSAPDADPDGDGAPNLLEYALGSDPLAAAEASPVLFQISDLKFEISFPRLRHDLTYRVEASSDLVNWELLATNPGAAGRLVTVADSVSLTGNARRFLRLVVER